MDDDTKLKIVFYTALVFAIVALIGIWEYFLQPFLVFIVSNVSWK